MRSTCGADLADAVGDFGDFELGRDFFADALEFAGFFEGFDPVAQIVVGQGVAPARQKQLRAQPSSLKRLDGLEGGADHLYLIDWETEALPLVVAAAQGADALDAQLVQGHGGFGGGGFAGAGAEEHDVAVAGDLVMARGERRRARSGARRGG